MPDRPLRVEYELEFVERFETIRIALDVDSMQPEIRALKKKALLTGGTFVLVSLSASSLFLLLIEVPLSTPFHAVFVATMLIWAFSWIYRHALASSIAIFLTKNLFHFSCGQAGPGVDGFGSIELSDDALYLNDQFVSALYRWPCVWTIKRSKKWSHLKLIDHKWLLIPSRAFESDEEYEWFIDEIERRNSESGGASGLITEHLKEYTLDCPKCKYPLHQIPQARCPECGREIGFDDFRVNTSELFINPEDFSLRQP